MTDNIVMMNESSCSIKLQKKPASILSSESCVRLSFVQKSSFSQTHKIGNNANIPNRGSTMPEQKNRVTECYHQ